MVVGQKTPVTIWEPYIEGRGVPAAYQEALALYRRGDFSGAGAIFAEYPSDKPSAVMAARCEAFIEKGAPENWSGVWILSSK